MARDDATVISIRLFELLPEHPILTVNRVVGLLNCSRPAASKALRVLEAAEVLWPLDERKKNRAVAFTEYLDYKAQSCSSSPAHSQPANPLSLGPLSLGLHAHDTRETSIAGSLLRRSGRKSRCEQVGHHCRAILHPGSQARNGLVVALVGYPAASKIWNQNVPRGTASTRRVSGKRSFARQTMIPLSEIPGTWSSSFSTCPA